MKIGVFDSGMGGLLILEALRKELPEYDYIFYGDTKNLPYGNKSKEEVLSLSQAAFSWLSESGCGLIICACNSVSAEALEELQGDFETLGVILPTVQSVRDSGLANLLLIATKRTVDSYRYENELSDTKLFSVAAPELALLIEENKYKKAIEYASSLIDKKVSDGEVEGVILGCTHYSKIKDQLRAIYPEIRFFSQDEIIPNTLINYLNTNIKLSQKLSRGGGVEHYYTGKSY